MRRPVSHPLALLAALTLAAAPASAQGAGPQFTDDVLEITPARIDALRAGLSAETAARPGVEREHAAGLARYEAAVAAFPARQAEYRRAVVAWQADVTRFDGCAKGIEDRVVNGAEAEADRTATMTAMQRFDDPAFKAQLEARVKDLAARMQAAQQRGDQKAMLAYGDSLRAAMSPVAAAGNQGMAMAQRSQARTDAAVEEIRRTCGENPESKRPRSPESPGSQLPTAAHEQLEAAGAAAARLTARQYAVLKERVGAYLALKKHGAGIATQYAYAPSERAALDAALPGVLAHESQLADW